jgi:DNA (cytosine-5)-methyltransferase 3A
MVSIITQPKDRGILLKDILESEVDEKYYLSERMINSFKIKTQHFKDNGGGFCFKPTEGNNKGRTLTNLGKNRMDDNFIVHNTMPRSGNPKQGGTGHLSRTDGKTYCLDTGSTNAIEIVAMRGRGIKGNIEQQLESNGTNKSNSLTTVQKDNLVRRLTPTECKKLQTVPDWYDMSIVSDSQQYKMLGNGWTVEVIKYLFSFVK